MKLYRYKNNGKAVMGVLKDDVGGTYQTAENAKTLIPDGTYTLQVCHSPKFGRDIPLLYNKDVPSSHGIRIHEGNNPIVQSQGCILIGNGCNLKTNKLSNSAEAMEQLLRGCKRTCELEIKTIG